MGAATSLHIRVACWGHPQRQAALHDQAYRLFHLGFSYVYPHYWQSLLLLLYEDLIEKGNQYIRWVILVDRYLLHFLDHNGWYLPGTIHLNWFCDKFTLEGIIHGMVCLPALIYISCSLSPLLSSSIYCA